MKIFKILIPCYNDWKSLFKLLDRIDFNIKEFNEEFSVIIVNDCSTEQIPNLKMNYKKIISIDVIHISQNQGHTRCNATGIKYLSKNLKFDYLILMDGDCEDRPEDLPLIINRVLKNKNISVVATRARRSEGTVFKLLYQFHKLTTLIFTGKNMNFGHYSCLTKEDALLLSTKKGLWSNFAGTAKKFIHNLDGIPTDRGNRYFGPSKMPLRGLIVHSLSIISTFKNQVLLRSLFIILSFILLFYIQPNFFYILVSVITAIFCLVIFFISKRENLSELNNSLDRIHKIENIHTIKL